MTIDTAAAEGVHGRNDVELRHDVRIPTAESSVTLSADIYLPAGKNLVPALITMTPYRKDKDGDKPRLRWLAERGYACLYVDLRGCGSSDGARRPEWDPGEADDAVAAIEWAAAQPWCDGNVGMWGGSYEAHTTLRVASRRPPHLKAIMAMNGPSDPEFDFIHRAGARSDWDALASRGGSMLAWQLLPPLYNHHSVSEQARWRHRLFDTEPVIMDFARHGVGDPVWRERAIDARSITVPAFFVGGWLDRFADAMPRVYEQVSGPKKLLMGPWGHAGPENAPVEPIDFLSIALRWWDRWLRDMDNGVMDDASVLLFLQGTEPGWRAFESWPPATGELRLTTASDTTLVESGADTASPTGAIAHYHSDPTIGTLNALWGTAAWSGASPALDQHDDDMRALAATSEPVPDDLLICGRPEVFVRLSSGPVTDEASVASAVRRLVVRLTEVDRHGRSRLITSGVLCPNGPCEAYRIALWPTAYRITAGHRIRVVLSDSDFPRLTPVRDPSSLHVLRIELSVPTLPEHAGSAIDMPKPEDRARTSYEVESNRDVAVTIGAVRCSITRDPINDDVEIVTRSGPTAKPTSQGHLLETSDELRARVQRSNPEAAVTTGTHTLLARMRTGETITVTAAVRCTQTALWARGEVTIDGYPTFSRIWEATLEDFAAKLGVV